MAKSIGNLFHEELKAWWHSMYWRWGVGECCLFYFPHWNCEADKRSEFKPEHERRILQGHIKRAVMHGYNPHAPEYFLMVARGGWNSLIMRHNHLIRAKWRIPLLRPEGSYTDERELLVRAGNCYVTVANLRDAEKAIFDYMQGSLQRERQS